MASSDKNAVLSGFRRLAFSGAVACNMFAMTGLLIFLGVLGYADMAAEVGIVQGATLAVFLAFSANARNLILGAGDYSPVKHLFFIRLVLLFPLALLSYFLSSQLVHLTGAVAALLIFRRGAEWFAELQISERERDHDHGYAWRFIGLQTFSFVLLLLAFSLRNPPVYRVCLVFWALSPLLQLPPFVYRTLTRPAGGRFRLAPFLPHLGSSWVIAISVYVFRVLVVLLVGKSLAGQLFSAYATGGMVSSVYTYALGPSLVSFGDGRVQRKINWLTAIVVLLLFLAGGATLLGALYVPSRAPLLLAMGFSLFGGGVMLVAQRKRIQILQLKKDSTFVSDIIINILLIASVPLSYYLLGNPGLYAIFLLSACLSCFFYYLSYDDSTGPLARQLRRFLAMLTPGGNRWTMQALVLFAFFFPLFFQLDGHLFDSTRMAFDTHGSLAQVPLPLAVIFSLVGIALLLDERKVVISASVIFAFFLSMILPTFLLSGDMDKDLLDKLVFLVQVIFPMFALLLGQSYQEPARMEWRFEAVFLYVLVLIVPVQLLASRLRGMSILVPDLGFFSLYQHLQYLPVLFVGMYFLAMNLSGLSRPLKLLGLFLAPLIGIYAAASLSTPAMALALAGCLLTVAFNGWRRKFAVFISLSCLVVMLGYGWMIEKHDRGREYFAHTSTANNIPDTDHLSLETVKVIKGHWQYYWAGATESPRAFLLGHASRPERGNAPSAHNYYLDLLYTFGIFALAPIFYLLIHTLRQLRRVFKDGSAPPDTVALAVLVLFLVLVDNSFKVGLRQPYPGMITFFLWGVLLNRLQAKMVVGGRA